MKTMKDFVAQQLSKKQMNEVKGGIGLWHCTWEGGENYFTDEEKKKFASDWKANAPYATPLCEFINY